MSPLPSRTANQALEIAIRPGVPGKVAIQRTHGCRRHTVKRAGPATEQTHGLAGKWACSRVEEMAHPAATTEIMHIERLAPRERFAQRGEVVNDDLDTRKDTALSARNAKLIQSTKRCFQRPLSMMVCVSPCGENAIFVRGKSQWQNVVLPSGRAVDKKTKVCGSSAPQQVPS